MGKKNKKNKFQRINYKKQNKHNPNKTESPNEIFTKLKGTKKIETEETLDAFYKNAGIRAANFAEAGQIRGLKHIQYLMECVEREKKLIPLGINSYIYRDDILDFLDRREIKASNIKIIELEDYVRAIPKDVMDKVSKSRKIFDYYYVLFTDYSNKESREHQRRTEQYKKDNDPILFGTFQKVTKAENRTIERDINDKFYVVGDWEDEYCDITLDKFIKMTSKDTVHQVEVPLTLEEIDEKIKEIEANRSENISGYSL